MSVASPSRGRFGRRCRVRAARDFRVLLARGRRARGEHFAVALRRNELAHPRLALAIARAAGTSPARARLRRLLREAFRALRSSWPAIDLLVSCRTPWPKARLQDVIAELEALVARAGRSTRRRGPHRSIR